MLVCRIKPSEKNKFDPSSKEKLITTIPKTESKQK
jgi:hypothetical protein